MNNLFPLHWLFAEKPVVDRGTSTAKILRMNFAEELEVAKKFMTDSALIRTFRELTRQHLLFSTNPDVLDLFVLRGAAGHAIFHRRQEEGFVSLTLIKVVGEHPCRVILEANKLEPVTVSAEKGRLFYVEAETRAQKNLVHYLNNKLVHTNSKVSERK